MSTRTRVWYVDSSTEAVDWSAAVVGGKATIDIFRYVDNPGAVDDSSTLFARAGQLVSTSRIALAESETSPDDVLSEPDDDPPPAAVDDEVDDDELAAALTNLGLGTAATRNTGTGSSNVILGNDARLSDVRTPADGTVTGAKIVAGGLPTSAITGTAVVTADARLSDTRTPTDGSVTDAKVSGLDGAKVTGQGSLRVATSGNVKGQVAQIDTYFGPITIMQGTADDATDNAAALNAAVAALGARGGTVLAGPGVFRFTTAPAAIPSNVRIVGAGKYATIFKKTYNGVLLDYSGASNGARCQRGGAADLQLNGNSTTTGALINAKWADHLNFDRVWCYLNADSAVILENVWDSYFNNCEFEWTSGADGFKPAVHIRSNSDDSSNIIVFNECRWESFTDGALWITSRAPSSAYTMVTGTNPPYGIYLQNCKMETANLRGYFVQMSADVEVVHIDGLYGAARGLASGITTGRTLFDLIGSSELTVKRVRLIVNGVTNPTVKTVFHTFTNAPGCVLEDVVIDAVQALGASSAGSGGGIMQWGGGTPETRVTGVRYRAGQSGVIDFGAGTNPRYPSVASASTIAVSRVSPVVNVTGTTGITSITAGDPGQQVTLRFAGAVTVTDGSNLKMAGNFTSAADGTLTLVCDGTNWFETARTAN